MTDQFPGQDAPAPADNTTAPEVETSSETPVEGASTPPDSEAQSDAKKQDAPPVQKRLDQLTWKAHEAERRYNAEIMRRQQLEDELRQYRERELELKRIATMPTMDQVGLDPEAYQKAMAQHFERSYAERREAEAQAQKAAQMQAARAAFDNALMQKVAEGQSKYNDFADVVGNPALPPLNPALVGAVLQHEQMPDILYYLGKNAADVHRINALPPAQAIFEVGKIAAKLPGRAEKTNAPPPPATVGGSAKASSGPSDSDSVEDWVRKREAQIRARR